MAKNLAEYKNTATNIKIAGTNLCTLATLLKKNINSIMQIRIKITSETREVSLEELFVKIVESISSIQLYLLTGKILKISIPQREKKWKIKCEINFNFVILHLPFTEEDQQIVARILQ